ncbi:TetR/AcrR family transcriptional regulator [Brevibacillus sp. SYSU BS000544]|uniref:TetR/AcrR family transcriptional regulator n=1 Tax=Brevibacillus sp. SYSU BS000544 TaxID=3416443 RepID=UPI003CE5061A
MRIPKKDHIAMCALRAFSQYGYSETTMDVIADTAQVAKGTLYYHFKTKEDLFYYVNKKGVGMLIDRITETIQDESHSVEERLLAVLDEHIRFFYEQQELCLLLLNFTSGNQKRDEIIRVLLADYFATLEKYLSSLQQKGCIHADLEVHTLASALFGMVGITVIRNMYRGEQESMSEVRSTLVLMCKGMLGIKQ